MKTQQNELFSHHEHALEKEHGLCPKCGLPLQIKNSKHGAFLGCSGYPSCDYSRPLVEHERMEQQVIEGSSCPKCNHELAIKKGRYGIFIGCTNYPECNHIEDSDVEEMVACPACNDGQLAQRVSKYGKTFYACNNYPKCKFVVNFQPIAGNCEKCDFPLLLQKKSAGVVKFVCASKKCGHKQSDK